MTVRVRFKELKKNFDQEATVGLKCDFREEELQVRITELVVVTTPNDDYTKELLATEKGYTVKQLLQSGRK